MNENEIVTAAATEGIKVAGEMVSNIYIDIFQPAAQEIGKYLGDWVATKFEHLRERVEQKAKKIPPERRVNVQLEDILPILEAYKNIKAEDEELQDMFANLLASYADSETHSSSHPAFVKIISEMSPFDAWLLKEIYVKINSFNKYSLREDHIVATYFGNTPMPMFMIYGTEEKPLSYELRLKAGTGMDNLVRLNMLDLCPIKDLLEKLLEQYQSKQANEIDADGALYDYIRFLKNDRNSDVVNAILEQTNPSFLSLSIFGRHFCETCIK